MKDATPRDNKPASLRQRLRRIVEFTDTPAGRAFDAAIMLLILASMAAWTIATLPSLSETTRAWLETVEKLTLVFFVVECMLRWWVAQKPLRYATSFFGIVDFVSLQPVD